MNGFCIQQTSFPFLTIISDDASTDGEQRLISRYLDEFFAPVQGFGNPIWETDDAFFRFVRHKTNTNCFFLVIFLKTNHYSINKSKAYLYSNWEKSVKYIALCEGDDYWIASDKLQKQVAYLESNPGFVMVCNRTGLFSEKHKRTIGENHCYNKSRKVKKKDVIYRSGLFISTCSIVYRKSILENYPDYCINCAVGDYPLQIMAAMKGEVYYFNDTMSVYRINNPESWMSMQKWRSVDENNIQRVSSMINMFKGFSGTYPRYEKLFSNKIAQYLITQAPSRYRNNGADLKKYMHLFHDEVEEFPLFWKIIRKLSTTNIPILRGYYVSYTKPIFKRFKELIDKY
jgi:hypothetical protein